MVGWSIY